jgi:hypothetical protein
MRIMAIVAWCLGLVVMLTGATAAQAQIWTEYRPPEGRYYVLMPGAPQTSTEPVPIAGGQTVQMYQAIVETPNAAYLATYVDYPPEMVRGSSPDTLLDNVRNGSAKGHTLRGEKRLTIAQNKGREYVIARSNGVILVTRSFLVGNRLYQIIAAGTPGVEQNPDTAKFLESFRLLTGN